MIALASDCLLFQMSNGESHAFSAEMISVELMGDALDLFDTEFVRHASQAVFHYFKHDQGRQTVTVGEFATALEKVLRGFALTAKAAAQEVGSPHLVEWDLSRLACESGKGCELFFFPRLKEELERQLRDHPRVLRFRGLRRCVKQLIGARRWTTRCEDLKEEILSYLRYCFSTQPSKSGTSLVVVSGDQT